MSTEAKMNPEIKSKWVTALRSGEYKQGRGMLHDTEVDAYCCLGVLCDLAAESGVPVKREVSGYRRFELFDGLDAVLPPSVKHWAGLDRHSPRVGHISLAARNDGGSTFSEIADLIEEHL